VETAECAKRYAGEFYDSATGLYYLRARYYDSEIGRFISEDSYTGEKNDPLSLNLYTYCVNNPIMYTDPSGHRVDVYGPRGEQKEKTTKVTSSKETKTDTKKTSTNSATPTKPTSTTSISNNLSKASNIISKYSKNPDRKF
jgi:RHS repeat-associated protein